MHVLLVLFFLANTTMHAQVVQWSKSFRVGNKHSEAHKILMLEDSTFRVLGASYKFGWREPVTLQAHYGLAFTALEKNGDTSFVRNMYQPISGMINSLAKSKDGYFFMGFSVGKDTVFNSKLRILKCDLFGNVQWMYPFIGDQWTFSQITAIHPLEDGGCFAAGNASNTIPGQGGDMVLFRFDSLGGLLWERRYHHAVACATNNMEAYPDGTFHLSGIANDSVWSIIVDSIGSQISEHSWYRTLDGTTAYQGIIKTGQNYYYGYNYNTFNGRTTIIRFDENKNPIWTKQNAISGLPPFLSLDGGYSRWEGYSSGNVYFRKYHADSSLNWSVLLTSNANNPEVSIFDIAYDGLGSAVLAGSKHIQSEPTDMYFIKVSNVGYPVDPLSSSKSISTPKEQATLNPYPNPAERYFYLGGLKAAAKVQLFDLQGKKLGQYTVQPQEPIPVWSLKEGLYVWRASDGRKTWSGKILKR